PGNDPFVITVGAADMDGNPSPNNDTAPSWSAYGYTNDGFDKPEISADGRYMVGPIPMGSTLAVQKAANIVTPGYIQLSGTSFAAPIVSGIAAQILARSGLLERRLLERRQLGRRSDLGRRVLGGRLLGRLLVRGCGRRRSGRQHHRFVRRLDRPRTGCGRPGSAAAGEPRRPLIEALLASPLSPGRQPRALLFGRQAGCQYGRTWPRRATI